MRPIHLIVQNGPDEIGRLPLPNLAIAPPADTASTKTVRPQLAGYIDLVVQRAETALAAEGLTVAISPVAFRLVVAQAMVAPDAPGLPPGDRPVYLTVPVHGAVPLVDNSSTEPGREASADALDLTGLISETFAALPADDTRDTPTLAAPDLSEGDTL